MASFQNTKHSANAVYIEDDGVVRYEGGTICSYDEPGLYLNPTAVHLHNDGYFWSCNDTDYSLKYGSLDKLPPLVLDARTSTNVSLLRASVSNLYLCPLGYLRSTATAVRLSGSGDMRYTVKLSGEATACRLVPLSATLADSWYTPRPKGYLYRLPYNDPPSKMAEPDLPFDNLQDKGKDVDKTPAWSEAEDRYYLSRYSWGTFNQFDKLLSCSAGMLSTRDDFADTSWLEIFNYDLKKINSWNGFEDLDALFAADFRGELSWYDFESRVPWRHLNVIDNLDQFPWSTLFPQDGLLTIQTGGAVCYLIPQVVYALPDGAALSFDFISRLNPGRFQEAYSNPPFMTWPADVQATLYDDSLRSFFRDCFVREAKTPPAVAVATSPLAVFIDDVGASWLHGQLLGYYDLAGTAEWKYSDRSEDGKADVDLDRPFRLIRNVPSPGCYERPVDVYPDPPDETIIYPSPHIVGRSWNIMSSATLVRASDGAVIPVTSISLDTDIDSWCWSFSATVKTAAGLDLCKPVSATPVKVIAMINGYSWHVLVDGYSERGSFGNTSYSITGRTIAVELASPMAEPGSKVYDNAGGILLSQIFDQELLRVQGEYEPDWTGVWNAQDGLIPPSTFTYQDKTPIEVITTLAAAVGAFVHHDPISRTLYVDKRYKVNPWDFTQGAEDMALDHSSVISTGMAWKPTPEKNGVYVSGTTSDGYLCLIKRGGTDGQKALPMITDPLIVTPGIALERGRYALNQAGKKGEYSIELPLLLDSEEGPVLHTPGKVLKMYPAPTWFGVVKAVSVGARVDNRVVVVRQQITVERHFE